MMNKMKTARAHLARFLFVLPVLALLLISFRNDRRQLPVQTVQQEKVTVKQLNLVDTVPAAPVNSKGFYIDIVDNKGSCTVVVKNHEKKELERVELLKWKEKEDYYVGKYGEVLAPGKSNSLVPKNHSNVEYLEIDDKKATVRLKNKTVESYDLSSKDEKAKFENKYGKVIDIPSVGSGVSVISVDGTGTITGVGVGVGQGTGVGNGSGIGIGQGGRTTVSTADAITAISPEGVISSINTTNPITVTKMANGSNIATTTQTITPIMKEGVSVMSLNAIESIFNNENTIVITIEKKTSRADLEKHKQNLKSQGIDIEFTEIEYNDNGELVELAGKLKYQESTGNFVAKDFSKVKLYIAKDEGKIHIRISVQDKVVS